MSIDPDARESGRLDLGASVGCLLPALVLFFVIEVIFLEYASEHKEPIVLLVFAVLIPAVTTYVVLAVNSLSSRTRLHRPRRLLARHGPPAP